MKVKTDIVEKKFGRLKVLSFSHMRNDQSYWNCVCTCGNKKTVRRSHLLGKNTVSCGCYTRERASKWLKSYAISKKHHGKGNPAFIHGETGTDLHKIYLGMKSRCEVFANTKVYRNYGGRGIKVLWKSYLDFKRDMGRSYLYHLKKYGRKQTTIDRIDFNGHYSKSNCRWATYKIQANNRRKHVRSN